MKRVLLFHWKAEELPERLARLERAGVSAIGVSDYSADRQRMTWADPPDAVVIDLTRLPSHGRAVGVFLRQRKATRHVPLIFVGGAEEKVAATRALLPDAVYGEWDEITALLQSEAPAAPARPGTMDAYAGAPLEKKLGLREGETVALVNAPPGFELPGSQRGLRGPRDRVLLFVRSAAQLEHEWPRVTAKTGKALWIVWPKQASGEPSDLTQPVVRRFGLARGWVDYKVCSVDATWTGLCFRPRA